MMSSILSVCPLRRHPSSASVANPLAAPSDAKLRGKAEVKNDQECQDLKNGFLQVPLDSVKHFCGLRNRYFAPSTLQEY